MDLLKKSILPITIITGGILISNSKFEKSFQRNTRNAVGNDFNTTIKLGIGILKN